MQAVLSRGDQRLAEVLLAIPSGGLTVRSFFQAMADYGLEKERYTGAWEVGAPLPWGIVQSGVSENYFHYELRLAAQNRTGLSCPPDSAGCLACQACDAAWAFRYGEQRAPPRPSRQRRPLARPGLAALEPAEDGTDWRPVGHEVGRQRMFAMERELVRPTSCPIRGVSRLSDSQPSLNAASKLQQALFFPCRFPHKAGRQPGSAATRPGLRR